MQYPTIPSQSPAIGASSREYIRNPPRLHFPNFVKQQRIATKSRTFSTKSCLSFRTEGLGRGVCGVGNRDAVMIVDHGSRRIESNLMLSRHWHQDIPALAAEAAKDHSGVSYMITAPLGLHELMVDVMNDRIKHCMSHVAGDAEECSVCAGTGRCHLY